MTPQTKIAKQNPKVGIIIPIYNVEKYLRECLDSVLAQSYENLEIVLVDDKSTDSSLFIAREYASRDERIALIALSENSGNSVARNVGIEYLDNGKIPCGGGGAVYECHRDGKALAEGAGRDSARAEFIHFVDSDDWLEHDCIEKCVETALAQDAQIVFHWRRLFYDAKNARQLDEKSNPVDTWGLEENKIYSGLEIFKSLPQPSFAWVAWGIVRLDFLTRHNLKFELNIEFEDTLFGIQLFALSKRIVILNQPLYIYRIRHNSICQYTLSNAKDNVQGLDYFPANQRDVAQAFGGNVYFTKHYVFAYSMGVIVVRLEAFLKKYEFDDEMHEFLLKFMRHQTIGAFFACALHKDPRNCRKYCRAIYPYSQLVSLRIKMAYHFPKIYHSLKWVKNRILGWWK